MMSKVVWSIAGGILLLVVVGGGIWWWGSEEPDQMVNLAELEERMRISPSPIPIKLLSHTDESGFSFQYGEDLKLTAEKNLSEDEYAKLKLSDGEEMMEVILEDTKLAKLADWLKDDERASKELRLVGSLSLDGVAAQQYQDEKRLFTLAIDQGVLYYAVSPNDTKWEKIHETVIQSFRFASEDKEPAVASGGGDAIYEEEEVVE